MLPKKKKSEKEKKQTIIYSVFIGVMFLSLIGLLVYYNFRINGKRGDLLEQAEELRREIELLEEKNSQLESGILKAGQDSYWEERIRNQGYKKPGEEQVVILPPEGENEEKPAPEKNIWQKIIGKIGF